MHVWVVDRNRDSEPISGFISVCPRCIFLPSAVNATTGYRCYQYGAAGPWQVVTLIAGSKRQSLLMAGDDDEMFMARSLNVTPTTTEHLTVHSDKSVACVTNIKKLCSTFCTILLFLVCVSLTVTGQPRNSVFIRRV